MLQRTVCDKSPKASQPPPTDQYHADFSSRAINRAHKTNFGNSTKVSLRCRPPDTSSKSIIWCRGRYL